MLSRRARRARGHRRGRGRDRAQTEDTRAPSMLSRHRRPLSRVAARPGVRATPPPSRNSTHRAAAAVPVPHFASAVRDSSIRVRAFIGNLVSGFTFPKGSRRSTGPIRGLAAAHGQERRLFATIFLSQPRLARTQAACRPQRKESPWCVSYRDAGRSVASMARRSHRPRARTADRERIASRSGFHHRLARNPRRAPWPAGDG